MVRFEDFVLRFTLWTFTVHLSTAVRTSDQDLARVIGSFEPIVATQGDDVILPCHVEPLLEMEELTVEWRRLDLPPDPGDSLSQYKYVHRYHDKHSVEDMKMSSYAGRTALVKDVSLKITKVKLSDQGRYRCSIPQLESSAVIQLVVETVKTTNTETPPVPRHLTTTEWTKEMDIKVQCSRSRLILVSCGLLILCVGLCGYLQRWRSQTHVPKHVTVTALVEPPPV